MSEQKSIDHILEVVIRIGLLAVLLVFCFQIIRPFLDFLIGGVILATAVYPLYKRLLPYLKDKGGLTATAMVAVTLLLLIVPIYELSVSFIDIMQSLNQRFEEGTLQVPPPREGVQDWPIIGERLYAIWSQANANLETFVAQYREELATYSQRAIGVMAGIGGAVGSFILSTMIAGVFLAFAERSHIYLVRVFDRVAQQKGSELVDLCTQTIRSVAQGVIGIALIQAVASGIGFVVMDIPGTAVWVLLILVLAIVQLPPMIVMLPIVVYVFSVHDTLPALLFMVYGAAVSVSDTFLKPLLLGRGMELPMPIILFGAIGGVLLMGIMGLFIGAIVLAIGYTLFTAWVDQSVLEEVPADNGDKDIA